MDELFQRDKHATRRPLAMRPARQAGDSLRQARHSLLEDKFDGPAILAICLFFSALIEWAHELLHFPPQHGLLTLLTIAATLWTGYRFISLRPLMRNMALGIEGEVLVGQNLDQRKSAEQFVIHDVPTTHGNIDHVVIGPTGVFAVETKFWSKPASGPCNIAVQPDGALVKSGVAVGRGPVDQAVNGARWLSGFYKDRGFGALFVQPIVVFPGWYIDHFDDKHCPAWVVNLPGLLPSIDKRRPPTLGSAEVRGLTAALVEYVRGVTEPIAKSA